MAEMETNQKWRTRSLLLLDEKTDHIEKLVPQVQLIKMNGK